METKKLISVGAVIFRIKKDQHLFLLLHYEQGHWDFPRGCMEPGEDEIHTAKREIAEETGLLSLKYVPGFKEKFVVDYVEERFIPKHKVHKTFIHFLAQSVTDKIKLSQEHTEFAWLSYEDAYLKITYENSKAVLKEANTYLERKK